MPSSATIRLYGKRAALAVVAMSILGGMAAASSTHNYYDAAGRFVGSTEEPNGIRSNRFDGADNRTLWQSLLASTKNSSQQIANYQVLFQGQSLNSATGGYILAMQEDGNAVVYSGSTPIWSTGTGNTNGASFDMQGDGNLVLYDAQWNVLWKSCTSGNNGASVVMQSDGNLVIYAVGGKPLWASKSGPASPQC